MGINATQTSYAFGQLGSAHCKTANSVFPPKGMVICAVQFLAANTPTIMRSEASSSLAQEHFACLSTAIKFSERSFFNLFSIIPIGIHWQPCTVRS